MQTETKENKALTPLLRRPSPDQAEETEQTVSTIQPKQYTVTKKKGSMVTVQRGDHQVTRNSSLFKRVGLNTSHKEEEDSESESDSEYNPHPQQESPEAPTTPTHNPQYHHQDIIHCRKGSPQPNSRTL